MTRALSVLPLLFMLAGACVTPAAPVRDAAALPPASGGARYVEVRDSFLRVREVGEGDKPPLLLLHGYGSRLEIWRELQDRLAVGRRVIAFDQRGFGHSERSAGEYGPEAHAKDALALLEALGVERAVLVGHSYGGGVAARAALLQPERVAGLVLVDAFLLDEQLTPTFRWAQAPVLGELLFGAFYKEVPGEKYLLAFHDRQRFVTVEAIEEARAFMRRPGAIYAALETVRGMDYASVEAGYRDVQVPVLVVWGEEDRVTPLRAGKRVAARFDGASFVVLPGAGHVPSWEAPEGLFRAVSAFLVEHAEELP